MNDAERVVRIAELYCQIECLRAQAEALRESIQTRHGWR